VTDGSGRTVIRWEPPDEGVTRVILDGPSRLNAFTPQSFGELAETMAAADAAPGTRVILLTGAGRAFCAGLDLQTGAGLAEGTVEDFLAVQTRASAAITSLRHLRNPVIAVVRGPAFGAGFALALAADIRLCSPDATFCAAFIRIGLTGADNGTSWLLPRLIGLAAASEILLTGRTVDADEAARIGLVNRVVPPEDLEESALATARLIVGNTALGVALTKEALQHNLDVPSLEAAVAFENRGQTLAAQSPEFRARVEQFFRRRDPKP
jgi:enoyl-CoA hydratase